MANPQLLDSLLGLIIGGVNPVEAEKRRIMASNPGSDEVVKPKSSATLPPNPRPTVDLTSDAQRVQPVQAEQVAALRPDRVQPANPNDTPRLAPIVPDTEPKTPAQDAVQTSSMDPQQLPDAYKTPPDLSQMYLEYMQGLQRQSSFMSGATLIAAGLAQDQNKQTLIDLASKEQGTPGQQGDMFKTIFDLQTKAADEARKNALRAQLPAIAKAHGLSLQDVQVMFEGGTLDAFLQDAAKPNTEIVEKADGSKVLIDKNTGKEIRTVGGAKPEEITMMPDPSGQGGQIAVRKKNDGSLVRADPGHEGEPYSAVAAPPAETTMMPDPSGQGGQIAVKKNKDGTLVRADPGHEGEPYSAVAAPPEETTMMPDPSGKGGQVAVKKKKDGTLVRADPGHEGEPYAAVAPSPDKISIHETGDGKLQAVNDVTGKPIGEPFGSAKDARTDDMKEWAAARAAAEARGEKFDDFDTWLKKITKSRDVKPTSANVDPKTGIDYGNPPNDMTWAHNADGSFIIDPSTNTPKAVPISGSKLAEEQKKATEKEAGAEETRQLTSNVVTAKTDEAMKILDEDSWETPVTGMMGALASLKPGSRRKDLEAALDTVKANLAFDKLADMRANSPTGGALGNVSDTELRLLSSTFGSMDVNQSPEALKANLKLVHDILAGDPAAIEKFRREYVGKGAEKPEKPAEKPAANEPPPGAKKYRWDPVKKQRVEIQ